MTQQAQPMAKPVFPRPRLDEIIRLARRPTPDYLLQLVRKYGDTIHINVPGKQTFLFSHPDAVRDLLVVQQGHFFKGIRAEITGQLLGKGLLTSEGAFHKRQRRLIQPTFHRKHLASYAATMVQLASKQAAVWQDGAVVDMSEEMMRLTFTIAGRALFNVDVERDAPTVRRVLAIGTQGFVKFGLSPWAKLMLKLPLPAVKRFEAVRPQLDAFIYRLIDEHRQAGDQGDLLSLLLQTEDEDGEKMSDQQIRDEVTTLLMAGHETTANALSWSWYLLSQHPHVLKHLQQEADGVLRERSPTIEDVSRLPYTEQVLSEALRLYPPAWITDRTALCETSIQGIRIPAGTRVIVSQYVMQRDARYYPEPDHFDPERWTPELRANRPRFAYYPFGAGSRVCIGEAFAWTEAVLVLAILARQWEPRLVPEHPVEIEGAASLRLRYGLRMSLHQRAPATVQPGE